MSSVAVIGIGAKRAIGGFIADPIIGIWTCGITVRPVGACAIARRGLSGVTVVGIGSGRAVRRLITHTVVGIDAIPRFGGVILYRAGSIVGP